LWINNRQGFKLRNKHTENSDKKSEENYHKNLTLREKIGDRKETSKACALQQKLQAQSCKDWGEDSHLSYALLKRKAT